MHDPLTMAFDIKYPWHDRSCKAWPKGYHHSFITIWHKDPEKDGTDDSCGWFKRARHGDKKVLEKITREFEFEWKYWFDDDGNPRLSVIATTLSMFQRAAYAHFDNGWGGVNAFIKKNIVDIIIFAENPVDSLFEAITQKYGKARREDRIEHFSAIIYGWILRQDQKWWQHPRWHVWHWRIQIHPWQRLRRKLFDRCCKCGKRLNGETPIGNWGGDKIWHQRCDSSMPVKTNASAGSE